MISAVIGALRVILGADTAAFEEGLAEAQRELGKAARSMKRVGEQMSGLGSNLTSSLTLPIVAAGAAVIKVAGDFEAAMGRVSISTNATASEMEALEKQAREIGKATIFSASEAADAMDALAKTGVGVKDILGGAAEAAVNLAAAAGSELEPAAALVSDAMNQFKLTVKDMPRVVNGITGAVNESKLSFDDFRYAAGQAGGVAGGLGVEFDEFNAALAATSTLFSSGSDAGTSFKTFLQRLAPATDKAATAMSEIGFEAYTASGQLKPLREIAEELRVGLSGLSELKRNEILTEIFGSDAIRTAIGLMEQGSAGLDKIQAKIAATDAADQAAKRMQGFNGQLKQLGGSLEELAISIGETGFLTMVTNFVSGLASLIDKMSAANPAILKFGMAFAGVVALAGPVLFVLGGIAQGIAAMMQIAAAPGMASFMVTVGKIATSLTPLGFAITAAVAAFLLFRDDVEPVLQELWAAVQKTLGPEVQELFAAVQGLAMRLGAALQRMAGSEVMQDLGKLVALLVEAFGTAVITAIQVAIEIVTTFVQQVSNMVDLVSAVLSGDFAGAWSAVKEIVRTAVHGALEIINAIVPGWADVIRRTVTAIGTEVSRLISGPFALVKKGITEVANAFKWLDDVVVRHSYVPDMVTSIADWMAKLDGGMVEPAKKATKEAAEAFRQMRDDTAAVLQGLLTDTERKARAIEDQVAQIRAAMKAGPGKGGLTVEQGNDALQRLWERADTEALEVSAPVDPLGEIGSPGDLAQRAGEVGAAMQKAADDTANAWKSAWSDVGGSFRGMTQEWISTGRLNWQRLLNDLVTDWDSTMKVLQSIWKSVSSWLSRTSAGGGGSGWASALAAVAQSLPGFKDGGSFKVAGKAGIDANVVAFRATRGEMVDIRKPGNDNGPMGAFNLTVSPSPYFDARVEQISGSVVQSAAPAIASGGASMAQQRAFRQRRQMLG